MRFSNFMFAVSAALMLCSFGFILVGSPTQVAQAEWWDLPTPTPTIVAKWWEFPMPTATVVPSAYLRDDSVSAVVSGWWDTPTPTITPQYTPRPTRTPIPTRTPVPTATPTPAYYVGGEVRMTVIAEDHPIQAWYYDKPPGEEFPTWTEPTEILDIAGITVERVVDLVKVGVWEFKVAVHYRHEPFPPPEPTPVPPGTNYKKIVVQQINVILNPNVVFTNGFE